MKKKLTLSIEAELIPRAKRYAERREVSLSSVVEEALRELTGERKAAAEPFGARWRGRFVPAEGDDPRRRALGAKYL